MQGNLITNNGQHGICIGKGASRINAGAFKDAGSNRLMGDIASGLNTVPWGGPLGTSNTIQNNGGDGIRVFTSDDNKLQSNIITNNSGAGIELINSSENLVGAEDPANTALFPPFLTIPNPLGNVIQNNTGGPGVAVIQAGEEAIDNSILSNSIFGNAGNGIALITQ